MNVEAICIKKKYTLKNPLFVKKALKKLFALNFHKRQQNLLISLISKIPLECSTNFLHLVSV